MPINDFNESEDLEVITFRRTMILHCKELIEERISQGPPGHALYIYPPDIHSSPDLPPHIKEDVDKNHGMFTVSFFKKNLGPLLK